MSTKKIQVIGGFGNSFGAINTVSGSVNATISADSASDSFTLEAGDNITLVTNEATGVIKIIGADAPEAPEASLEALGISATPTELNRVAGVTSNIQEQLNDLGDLIGELEGAIGTKAAASHNHAASEITSGTLSSDRLPTVPVAKGGTGATTALAAQYNLLNDMNTNENALTDTSTFVFKYTTTASTTNGSIFGKPATVVKDYVLDGITGGASTVVSSNLTASRALISNSSGKVAVSDVTSTELGYLDGVTSNIQTQLDNMLNIQELGTIIPASADLNDYTTHGTYRVIASNASTIVNSPITSSGYKLIVVNGYSENRCHQFILPASGTKLYYRMYSSSVWTDWNNMNDTTAYVPTTRTVNGKALSEDISLTASDVGAAASSHGTHVTYGTSAKALGTSSAGTATTVSRSDHVHALPALTFCTGTLTVAKGGTGATTARAAQYNLLDDLNDTTSTAIADGTKFVFKYNTGSTTNGAIFCKDATAVKDYVLADVTGTYLPLSGGTMTGKINISDGTGIYSGTKVIFGYNNTVTSGVSVGSNTTETVIRSSGAKNLYHTAGTDTTKRVILDSGNLGDYIIYSSTEPTGAEGLIWLKPVS